MRLFLESRDEKGRLSSMKNLPNSLRQNISIIESALEPTHLFLTEWDGVFTGNSFGKQNYFIQIKRGRVFYIDSEKNKSGKDINHKTEGVKIIKNES
jgi:hypothetical protein